MLLDCRRELVIQVNKCSNYLFSLMASSKIGSVFVRVWGIFGLGLVLGGFFVWVFWFGLVFALFFLFGEVGVFLFVFYF